MNAKVYENLRDVEEMEEQYNEREVEEAYQLQWKGRGKGHLGGPPKRKSPPRRQRSTEILDKTSSLALGSQRKVVDHGEISNFAMEH